MNTDPIPIIGVSLGRRFQPTGLAVVERTYRPVGEAFNCVTYDAAGRAVFEVRERVAPSYGVRHLERIGPPSRYSKVGERLAEVVRESGRERVFLVLDITAGRRSSYELIYRTLVRALEGAGTRITYIAITITNAGGGLAKAADGSGWLIPRADVLAAADILFGEGQLRIAQDLSLATTLRDEFVSFEAKAANAKADDPDAWRVGRHDDLVLAVSGCVWALERFVRKLDSVPQGTLGEGSEVGDAA